MPEEEEEEETEPKYKLFVKGSEEPREEGSKWFTGDGRAFYLNGDTYEGTFVEGVRSSKGVYKFAKTGDSYEGFYELNKKQGFGKMTYRNQKQAEEEEEEEEQQGPVRGGTYLGYHKAGHRDGEGTFTYASGDTYVGDWKAGKKHGQGTYTYFQDDTKLVGEWENGKITNGKWVFPDGTFYCGKFRYNKPHGRGVWVFKNGNQVTGDYKQKERPPDDDEPEPAEGEPKPDPKVWCRWQADGSAAVRERGRFIPPKLGV